MGRSGPGAIGGNIVGLPAHQLAGTGGLGQCRAAGGRHARRANAFGQHLEGEAQQAIAGQDRHRLAEDLVARRPAAAEIVVVHGGQVVVNERIGMDHLHGTSGRHGRREASATGLRGHQHEHRPQAFARGQEAIANGLPQRIGASRPAGSYISAAQLRSPDQGGPRKAQETR